MSDAGKNQPSDGTLVQRYRRGAVDAATLLYFRYAEQVRALAERNLGQDLAGRVDPSDVVQSVFRSFFRGVEQGRFTVPEGDDLWKLFLVLALNKIRSVGSYHRAACRNVNRTAGSEEPGGVPGNDGEDANALTVLHATIEEILENQPPVVRQIIEARIDGFEVAEIAQTVQRSRRTVERVLHEFRQRLALAIGENGDAGQQRGQ